MVRRVLEVMVQVITAFLPDPLKVLAPCHLLNEGREIFRPVTDGPETFRDKSGGYDSSGDIG
ncbi:MAG: hypothetical protein ACK54P_12920, partial [Bacteroidota bacterium]